MSLRLINAGLGRTGTMTVKAALEMLGFGPCYSIQDSWTNPEHADVWHQALDGERVDWAALMQGYRSAVDWPVCTMWRELADAFPDAQILLTTRDPRQWFESFQATIRPALYMELPDVPLFEHLRQVAVKAVERTSADVLDDEEAMVAAFERHYAEVRATVPGDRLCEYDVRQGWGPLCAVLEVPVPDEPFPKVNDRALFQATFGMASPPDG